MVGVILSCYTLAALLIRPIAGFVLDMLSRKPIYIVAYLLFVLSFIGYPLAHLISTFLFLRMLHGFTFGFVTTSANSFIVDIMPASRRGEGLGFFGVSNTIAMALGPMTGLYMHDYYNFTSIFYVAIASGCLGFLFVLNIKPVSSVEKTLKQPIAFDRFFLFKGFKAGICLLLMGIPYGMLVTYIAIYGKELGIHSGVGVFFTLMALGLIVSRTVGGKMVDRGKLIPVILYGTLFCVFSIFALSGLKNIDLKHDVLILILFYTLSFLLGIGYGLLFPAYNALFVNLAPNNRRATASSTYMTSWDMGVGIGLISGGWLADSVGGLQIAYLFSGIAAIFSYFIFMKVAGPHFDKHKLR